MKANGAPEKLYLISDKDGVYLSYDPPTKLQGDRYDFVDKEVFPIEEGTDIEYTRTDAFIEKACDWLEEHIYEYLKMNRTWNKPDYDPKLIGDFKKYMKGE